MRVPNGIMDAINYDNGLLQHQHELGNNGTLFNATANAVVALAEAAAAVVVSSANDSNGTTSADDKRQAIHRAVLDQLQHGLTSTSTTTTETGNDNDTLLLPAGVVDDGDGETVRLPRNLTLIFNELQRFTFRSDAELPHGRTHAMTDEEYSRFVSDMWIGVVLTLLMVLIVLALCFWFLYHKFQQWKRQYNEAHSLAHIVTAGGTLQVDGDETLPNYTLVSGLPTYDDALEQIRHSHSANHLLINHETLMKLFGSTPTVFSKEQLAAAANTDEATAASQVCTSCNQNVDDGINAAESPQPSFQDICALPPRMYLARIEPLLDVSSLAGGSRRSSLVSMLAASAVHTPKLSAPPSAPSSPCSSHDKASRRTSKVITSASGHRYVCTTTTTGQPTPTGRRRASDVPSPSPSFAAAAAASAHTASISTAALHLPHSAAAVRLVRLQGSQMTASPLPIIRLRNAERAASGLSTGLSSSPALSSSVASSPRTLIRSLIDVPSNSLGSLLLRRDRRMRHNSARDANDDGDADAVKPHSLQQQHRWSLGDHLDADADIDVGGRPLADLHDLTGSTPAMFRHRASLY